MNENEHWVIWSGRNFEFAPVVGLHQHHLFYPTSVNAFVEAAQELRVFSHLDPERGPIYATVAEFSTGGLPEKTQYILHPKLNRQYTYMSLHGGRVGLARSAELQRGQPRLVYTRGRRNVLTAEAYVTYWFFYLENFVPRSLDNAEIAEVLTQRPNAWWTHEGDWEVMSVRLRHYEDSVPAEVILSQHNTRQRIPWERVEKQDGRPLAIVALGSHALFNRPLRKKRFLFWAEIASPDVLLHPMENALAETSGYVLEEFDPVESHLWLHFKGRWGLSGGELAKAPRGPLMRRAKDVALLADQPQRTGGKNGSVYRGVTDAALAGV